jgi:hypothetical protein
MKWKVNPSLYENKCAEYYKLFEIDRLLIDLWEDVGLYGLNSTDSLHDYLVEKGYIIAGK